MTDAGTTEWTDKTKRVNSTWFIRERVAQNTKCQSKSYFLLGKLSFRRNHGYIWYKKIPKREKSWPEIIRAELFRFWSEVCGCSDGQGTRNNIIGDHSGKAFPGLVNSSWRSHGDTRQDTSTPAVPSQWTAITMATTTQFPRLEETFAFILRSGAAGWAGLISMGLWTSDSPMLLWVSF